LARFRAPRPRPKESPGSSEPLYFKQDGNPYFSPQFSRGGLAGTFPVSVTSIVNSPNFTIKVTASQILRAFEHVDRHVLLLEGRALKTFPPTLDPIQKTVLRLLRPVKSAGRLPPE
jgi:hypothetical protein